MMVPILFLMNVIFDLRQEITFLQLQLHDEKFSKSKTNSCGNEEKIIIENIKSQITSYKTENKFLKEKMKSKQSIFKVYPNKVFIVGDSMIKNITGTGISRKNIIKMRPRPSATTIGVRLH